MFEKEIARAILGQEKASCLMTDAYKNAMAQAGAPLRKETFYLTFRKGDMFYNPFDLEVLIKSLLPAAPTIKEKEFLDKYGYGITPAMLEAITSEIEVDSVQAGNWFLPTEPILATTGPSFLASWLEPLTIGIQFAIRIATNVANGNFEPVKVSCQSEADIVYYASEGKIKTFFDAHFETRILENALNILKYVNKDKVFEVGLRGATCMEQHLQVLSILQNCGITKTSNLYGAMLLGMIPVGTTGHEHQQRWLSDKNGYCAIRDMRPGNPSYLFDTTNVIQGLHDAIDEAKRFPNKNVFLRFDSGNYQELFDIIVKRCSLDNNINIIFEAGYNLEKTIETLKMCESKWPIEKISFGYGGFFSARKAIGSYERDDVSAVYKLCMTDDIPVHKNGGEKGKGSLPGKPVIYRFFDYGSKPFESSGGYVAQSGEKIIDKSKDCEGNKTGKDIYQENFINLFAFTFPYKPLFKTVILSPETKKMMNN